MRYNAFTFLLTGLIQVVNFTVSGQDRPVVVQADSGILGSDFNVIEAGGVRYVTPGTDFVNTAYPGNDTRVITFSITFPDTGAYNLYGRLRVGPAADNDDSFFYGTGFGVKDPTNADDWVRVNNFSGLGFSEPDDLVYGGGGAPNNNWNWYDLTGYGFDEPGVIFHVPAGSLTQTFQVGGRENGLDMDKFVFGRSDLFFTVADLDSGKQGTDVPPLEPTVPDGPPLARGKCKFLGSVYAPDQAFGFDSLWNQVIPEDAGKWGSVEGVRDVMNWSILDSAYNLAQKNGFPFEFHILIWGNQQPVWIESLDSAEQRQEIEEWFDSVATRYPNIDILQVVNEPLHNPPAGAGNGNYYQALGGPGQTGWDWVIEAYRLARQYFPNAALMINDYNIVNNSVNTNNFIQIIELLQAENLIDAIGVQAHAFSTSASAATMTANLDQLATTGLPIYATEFDLSSTDEATHLTNYQRVFPVFWEHPAVKGVTLWGYRPGMWNSNKAYLLNPDGNPRASMYWLRRYVEGTKFDGDCILLPSAVTPVTTGNPVEVYPNPAPGGKFTIRGIEKFTVIRIFDLTGHEVASYNVANHSTLEIQMNTAPGVYLMQLSNGQQLRYKKIVIN